MERFMLKRRPVLLLLLGTLALVAWILQSVLPGSGLEDPDSSASVSHGDVPVASDQPGVTITYGEEGRVEITGGNPSTDRRFDPSLGVPAFLGRLLLPNGNPAVGAEVLATGIRGFAIYRDPNAEEAPAAENSYTTDEEGRFAVHEAPRDGLRFVLEFRAEGFPRKSMVNLPAQPGRTRDLGDIQLALGFALKGTVRSSSGVPIQGARVVAAEEPDMGTLSNWMLSRLQPLEDVEALSAADGGFSFPVLPPGRIRVRAEAEGFAPEWSASVFGEDGSRMDELTVLLSPSEVLAGILLDDKGNPVARMPIRIDPEGQTRRTLKTDQEGAFRFDLARGTTDVRLRIQAPGFFLLERRFRQGEHRNFHELVLESLPSLDGWVTGPTGAPIDGAFVSMVGHSGRRDPLTSKPILEGNSGKDGSFSLPLDCKGQFSSRYRLVARAEGFSPATGPIFSLLEGQSAPLGPFRISMEKGGEIRGVVVDPSGQTLSEARVHLRRLTGGGSSRRLQFPGVRRSGTILEQVNTDSEGKFAFTGLAAADFRLEAYFPGFSPAESDEISLVGLLQEVFLRLKTSSGIDGKVTGNLDSFGTLRVTAVSPGSNTLDALVDPEGRFTFDAIAPGPWTLELREVDSGIDTVFRWGGGEPLARLEDLEVGEGSRALAVLDLDLEGRAGIHGQVFVNGNPLPEFGVYLVARGLGNVGGDPIRTQRTVLERIRSTSTDHSGNFQIGAVNPGDWWLLISPPREWPNGVFWDRDERDGPTGLHRQRVELLPGDLRQIDIHLELGEVRGTAIWTQEGRTGPVPGGWGRLEPLNGIEGVGSKEVRIRGNGSFQVSAVPAGSWTLRLGTRGWRSKRQSLSVESNLNEVGDILLEENKD